MRRIGVLIAGLLADDLDALGCPVSFQHLGIFLRFPPSPNPSEIGFFTADYLVVREEFKSY